MAQLGKVGYANNIEFMSLNSVSKVKVQWLPFYLGNAEPEIVLKMIYNVVFIKYTQQILHILLYG